ncbi:MAG TPA: competence/damage-inducible protein A, partial [Candidatus Eisenbacteria bacterium]|nr:competence/damage-inducible protein A [Candidatus Eisenbacteria bacterium]
VTAEINTIGTELLHGLVRNTNGDRIVELLAEVGVEVIYQTTVGDETGRLSEAFRAAAHRARFVILTGGLGPTPDDMTRKAIATVFRRRLVLDESVLAAIRARFKARGIDMPAMNEAQALVPRGARVIENTRGTAPGLHFEHQGVDFFALPGVPAEAEAMLVQYVIPFIRSAHLGPAIARRVVRTIGVSESRMAEWFAPIEASEPDVRIGYLPHSYGLDITITGLSPDPVWIGQVLDRCERRILEAAGDSVYARGRATMSEVVGAALADQGLTLATAESFTAGKIGAAIVESPGASRYYLGGVIAYSDPAKEKLLAVKPTLLTRHGAVSEEVAKAMAEGARNRFGADLAVSSTGIAGPDGATATKPVGLVYLAIAGAEGAEAVRHNFSGTREEVAARSAAYALDLIRRKLVPNPEWSGPSSRS